MSDTNEPILQLLDVTKRFDGRTVIDRVSLSVMPGETMVIMGSSGCGKTTTLRMMIGDYPPDEGHVTMFGQELSELDEVGDPLVGRDVGGKLVALCVSPA